MAQSASSSQAIGERIKYYRQKKSMTQKELGEACGIDAANIRKYESGRQNAKIETLEKIANALEVGIGKLYGLELIDKIVEIATPEMVKAVNHISQIVAQAGTEEAERQEEELMDAFIDLNYYGREEAIKRIRELNKLPEYSYAPYDEQDKKLHRVATKMIDTVKTGKLEDESFTEYQMYLLLRKLFDECNSESEEYQNLSSELNTHAETQQDSAGDVPEDTAPKKD